jgi:hypothetical protein
MKNIHQWKPGALLALLALGSAGFLMHPVMVQAQSDGNDNSVSGDDDDYNAEMPPPPPHPCGGRRHGPPPSPEEIIASQLDLSSEQQEKVAALFEEEHEQVDAIHKKTCQKLESLLTKEQLEQFKSFSPPPPPPRFGRPPFGPPPGGEPTEDDLLEQAIDELVIG